MLQEKINKLRARRSERGFTLIEILFVLALIVVLSVLAIVLIGGQADNARSTVAQTNLESAYRAALSGANGDLSSQNKQDVEELIEAGTNLEAEVAASTSAPESEKVVYVYKSDGGVVWLGYKTSSNSTAKYLVANNGDYTVSGTNPAAS